MNVDHPEPHPAPPGPLAPDAGDTPAGLEGAINFLLAHQPAVPDRPPDLPPAVDMSPCAAPDLTPPAFQLLYKQQVLGAELRLPIGDGVDIPRLGLSCVGVSGAELYFGLTITLEQEWNLRKLTLGDLSSTLSLAPRESLTIEFQSTQRRLLDQTTLDQAEQLDSVEATSSDKEVLNAARTTTKTQNWHVDGQGQFSIGTPALGGSLGIQGGYQNSVQESAQNSVQRISESTKKSANTLKTLHKIEVRGVSEQSITNRMTRIIHNPYVDRALSLNVFQLIKHFSVAVDVFEYRAALVIPVRGLTYDAGFVVSYSDFLRQSLVDDSLVVDLPKAVLGGTPPPTSATTMAEHAAETGLRLLFEEPNIFNMPNILTSFQNPLGDDPNPPSTSFDERHWGERSGFDDALRNNLGTVFTLLNFYFSIYNAMTAEERSTQALPFATSLAAALQASWGAITTTADGSTPESVKNVLDGGDFTEIFRRLTGFLALISGYVTPLSDRITAEQDAAFAALDAQGTLARLLSHLECNNNYYTQQFLAYLVRTTQNQSIVDFVNAVLVRATLPADLSGDIRSAFDIDGTYLDKQQLVVPAYVPLTTDEVGALAAELGGGPVRAVAVIPAVTTDLQLPTDGIHVEVSPGRCMLENVPLIPITEVDASIDGAALRIQRN